MNNYFISCVFIIHLVLLQTCNNPLSLTAILRLRTSLKISRPGIASSKCFSYQFLTHDNVSKFIPLGENQSIAEVVGGPLQLTWPTSPLPTCKALPFPAASSFLQRHLFSAPKSGIVHPEQYYERAHNLKSGYLHSSPDFCRVLGCF